MLYFFNLIFTFRIFIIVWVNIDSPLLRIHTKIAISIIRNIFKKINPQKFSRKYFTILKANK